MPLNDFESLLKETVGLDAAALGRAMMERAVRDRATACGLENWQDYFEHVHSTEEELQALLDAVVTPDNWFFRDRPAFETLGRLAVQCWLTASHGEQLRLLSVGCGSGEEPYSMAMELLDCGFPAERIRIDAVDLSGPALARARLAFYGKTAFRGNDLRFSERYFTPVQDGFKLNPPIRQAVTFFRGNVLSESFLSARAEYDFILCRNLLGYFDGETQAGVMRRLHQALGKNGVLFLGSGEVALATRPEFVPIDVSGAFAFLKSGKRSIRKAAETARHLRGQVMSPAPPRSAGGAKLEVRSALDLALRLAERGQWNDVVRLCEAHVRDHGECAQSLYLLGRARDVQGQVEAARELYQRSLDLNSEHTLASLRLAQLPGTTGSGEADPKLQDRAPRSKQKLQP